MSTEKQKTLQESIDEFRAYYDKHLKPKKPGMANLDREVLVEFIRSTALLERKKGVELARKFLRTDREGCMCYAKNLGQMDLVTEGKLGDITDLNI